MKDDLIEIVVVTTVLFTTLFICGSIYVNLELWDYAKRHGMQFKPHLWAPSAYAEYTLDCGNFATTTWKSGETLRFSTTTCKGQRQTPPMILP